MPKLLRRLFDAFAPPAPEAPERAGRALCERTEGFRSAFDYAAIGMALVAPDGRFLEANRALSQLVGYSQEELLARTFQDITHPDDLNADLAYVNQMLRGEIETYQMEKRYLHKRGHVVWILLSVSAVYDEDGAVKTFIAQIQDITARKQDERLKDEFISIVSHELRTPLTSIVGSLSLLVGGVSGPLDDPVQRMLEIAHRNGERLVRLINDILDVQKIEAAKMVLRRAPQDLLPLIEQTLQINQAYADHYGVAFVFDADAPHVCVDVDADRLTQVMTNLLSNAVKFSPAGGTVEVAVTSRGRSVRVAVRDRGPGIPEAFRQHLFEKFAQADSSSTRGAEGTGLGLSIAKALVELHGGRIGFETPAGEGTCFYFDLPVWRDFPAPRRGEGYAPGDEGDEGVVHGDRCPPRQQPAHCPVT